MNRRHGLTLLEVLFATAILTVMVTATLPVLLQSMAALQEETAQIAPADLGLIATDILNDPAAYGFQQSLEPGTASEIEWTDRESPITVHMEVLAPVAGHTAGEHVWVIFQTGETRTARWYRLDNGNEGATEEESS